MTPRVIAAGSDVAPDDLVGIIKGSDYPHDDATVAYHRVGEAHPCIMLSELIAHFNPRNHSGSSSWMP
ncbi:hypothetical protein, partial [Massilia sp. CFBP 13647]|uniref:hypothetical protein n=1 Tax=Massilia sp. CFBP 13647 TaxID=2775276 RepID=UPI001A7E1C34